MPKGVWGFQKGDLNPSRKPERRKQISEQRKVSKTSEETRKKISASMKAALQDPELRRHWSEKQKGVRPSAATRAKISATHAAKPKSLSTMIHKADAVFSRFIRTKYSRDGRADCFTCGRNFPIPELDCGHFVGRNAKSTRYSELNCHPQCRYCNRYQEGMKDAYAAKLQEKYGDDIIKKLARMKNEMKQYTVSELQELIQHWQELTKKYAKEVQEN